MLLCLRCEIIYGISNISIEFLKSQTTKTHIKIRDLNFEKRAQPSDGYLQRISGTQENITKKNLPLFAKRN